MVLILLAKGLGHNIGAVNADKNGQTYASVSVFFCIWSFGGVPLPHAPDAAFDSLTKPEWVIFALITGFFLVLAMSAIGVAALEVRAQFWTCDEDDEYD